MPLDAYVIASVFVSPITATCRTEACQKISSGFKYLVDLPCLLAVYAHAILTGDEATIPSIDAVLTMTPLLPLGEGSKGSCLSIWRICAL